MASDDEDEELAALRFAALASMKSKQRPLVKEDEDLKALKEAALRSLEQTEVISSGPHKASAQNSIPAHLQPVQSLSPNYYSTHPPPPPPPQYVHNQYSQPPPNFPPPQALQAGSFFPQFGVHHVHHPSQQHLQMPVGIPMRDNSSRSSVPGHRGTGIASSERSSNTPPITTAGGTGPRGAVLRGNPPKRGNNLILISPMGAPGREPPKESTLQSQSCLPRENPHAAKQMLLRPQDKWCSSEGNSASTSPQRPKATGKFSRFDSSSSESDESESDEEPSPVNKSVELKECSDTEQKASDIEQRASDNDEDDEEGGDAKSKLSESKEDSENEDDNSIQSTSSAINLSKDSSDSDKNDSDNEGSDLAISDKDEENVSVEKKPVTFPKVQHQLETEEEKFERRETDRLLEEAVDQRHVLTSSSEPNLDTLTPNIVQNIPLPEQTVPSFDLAHKLAHSRAQTKKSNGDAVMDLSEKLKNRRIRPKEEELKDSGESSLPKGFENITIQKVVEDVPEKPSPKVSEEEMKRLEARKRKFESSPVPGNQEGKKTISLKGIVPRSKKRMKERKRSASPVPKCYSKDLQRYEKKHSSKVRHKSGSKENREQKLQSKNSQTKLNSKDKAQKKQEAAQKESSGSSDSSDAEEKDLQISDEESDEEDRSWRKSENKNKLVTNRDRSRPVRDNLDPVRVDVRHGRGHRGRGPRDQDYNRRPRFENSRTSRNSRLGDAGSGVSPRFGESGSGPSRRFEEHRTGDNVYRHKDSGKRHRSVELVDESDSDSNGPKLPSSVVLPSNKSRLNKDEPQSRDSGDDDSSSSRELTPSNSSSRSRSPVRRKTSRRVTTDEHKTLTLKTHVKQDSDLKRTVRSSRDRSPLSVTIDPDKESRSSVHKRLGRQLDSSVGKLKLKSSKEHAHKKKNEEREETSENRFEEESPQADDELEQRIQKIKAKNAAILKRQEEVRQDKERYG